MRLITLDFETYYAPDYGLSKMTTEEYIRDPRFEPLIVGAKVDDGATIHACGRTRMQELLDSLEIHKHAALAHHAHFDGLILNHHFGIRPKVWFDTLSMARALHGIEVGNSLKKLVEYYGIGEKGDDVKLALGMRLKDFTPEHLNDYARYCMDDVENTYQLLQKLLVDFPKQELKIVDMVVRMFTEPELLLDEALLRDYVLTLQANKNTLLFEAGVTLDEVMSADKFAAALQRAGITDLPMKRSMTTGKMAFAFAKTDKGLLELAEHPSDQVQALVAARLGNKTTINETRAQRMADMSTRGTACIYLNYSGAGQTHRLSGGDKMNWQNMTRGSPLRHAIYAPDGHVLVVADSSNIEARILDWLSMQEDAVEVYRLYDTILEYDEEGKPVRAGPDVYCVMATSLYGREITPANKLERQLGKVVKLACGYQMGPDRFVDTARTMGGLTIDRGTAETAVRVYRQQHPMVRVLWNRAQNAINSIAAGPDDEKHLDPRNLLQIEQGAILLPNGLRIRYPELVFDGRDDGWSFKSRRGESTKLYGGKVVENAVQALARIVVLEQTLQISKHSPARLSVHDEGVFCVPAAAAQDLVDVVKEVMSAPLWWCPDLPLGVSVSTAVRYGEAKT
jgi:DNA polymerase